MVVLTEDTNHDDAGRNKTKGQSKTHTLMTAFLRSTDLHVAVNDPIAANCIIIHGSSSGSFELTPGTNECLVPLLDKPRGNLFDQ